MLSSDVLTSEWCSYNKALQINGIDCYLLNHIRQMEKNRSKNRQCKRALKQLLDEVNCMPSASSRKPCLQKAKRTVDSDAQRAWERSVQKVITTDATH